MARARSVGDDHQRVHARGAEVASRGCDRGWCEMERVPWSTVARVDVAVQAGVWRQSSGMDHTLLVPSGLQGYCCEDDVSLEAD